MSEQNNQISLDMYVKSELGTLKYDNMVLKAQLDNALLKNQELEKKVQELESQIPKKVEEPKK